MDTALLLLSKTALFIALMIPGFLLGKSGQIDHKAVPSAANILTKIAMPSLILLKLIELDISKLSISGVIISFILPLFVEPLLALVGKFVFKNDPDRKVLSFCTIFPNCGFLGIPLSAALFPDNPEVTVYISIANITSTILYLTLGLYVISGDKNEVKPVKILLSPAIIASVLGGVVALTGISGHLGVVSDYLGTLSQITTPLAMIILGFEFAMPAKDIASHLGATVKPAILRLILSPAVTVLILFVLKICGVTPDIYTVNALFITMAMPPASSSPAMAARYGGNANRTAVVTVLCTVLCLATLPLLYLIVDLIF